MLPHWVESGPVKDAGSAEGKGEPGPAEFAMFASCHFPHWILASCPKLLRFMVHFLTLAHRHAALLNTTDYHNGRSRSSVRVRDVSSGSDLPRRFDLLPAGTGEEKNTSGNI